MEENLNQIICDRFGVGDVDIRSYSPLALAYIGDGIFDLVIRSIIVGKGNTSPNQLHAHTSHIVKAESKSKMIDLIQEELTEEEMGVYRRGRNAKSNTMAKNASMADYRNATGFEALMGYLYLQGNMNRILELTESALEKANFRI
jgi:ribonuclease-3 family protein